MGSVLRLERLPRTAKLTPCRLTKKVVEGIPVEPSGELQLRDAELKGFGVRVQPSGARTYFVQYREIGGRTRRLALGRHGVLTAEEARLLARQRLGEVARGQDPSAERKSARTKARKTKTVGDLIERFLREHVDAKRKHSTAREYRRLLRDRVLTPLGSVPVDAVRRDTVEALHVQLRSTPTEANRLLAVLSKMFNLAEAWGLRPLQSNPCYRIERYREVARDRFYSDAELSKIGGALAAAERDSTRPLGHVVALKLLAFSGCRVGEILQLRWKDVDLANGVLRLPDAKAGARIVPLGAPAVALLKSLQDRRDLVVWGKDLTTPLTYDALAATWKKVRVDAGISNARLHDLRHTIGSYAGAAGMNAFMVRDLLGHKTLAMTGHYVSQDTGPLQRAADEVVGRVANAMASKTNDRTQE